MLNPRLTYFLEFANLILFYGFHFSMDKGLIHSVLIFGHNQIWGFPCFGNSLFGSCDQLSDRFFIGRKIGLKSVPKNGC